jgi:tRNA-specific 2-thiouridylase
LYVGQSAQHPGLQRSALFIAKEDAHWVRDDLIIPVGDTSVNLMFRFRYRQPLQQGTMTRKEDGYYIYFDTLQSGIAAGQFAAWYQDNECIGSGVISD